MCDAGVGQPGHELLEDGALALGELGERLAGDGRSGPVEEAENAARDPRGPGSGEVIW